MNVTGTPARRLPAASLTVAVNVFTPASAPSPAEMSLTFGVVEATPVVVPLSPPRIVTVPTTGPVVYHVIKPADTAADS